MPVEIYLLRHGETEWNLQGRLQGHRDSPLSERGREQARRLGDVLAALLRAEPVVALQTSPLGRARETAAIIRAATGLDEAVVEPRLQEITMGVWDGLTPEEIDQRWPGALVGATRDDRYFRSPDGERLDAAVSRATIWLREQRGCIVAVSHGVIGKLIRGAHLGLTPAQALGLRSPHDVIWRLAPGNVEAITW